ncbi:MAG: FAD-dependent monooxygenase [Pseudomonadota bacterium]
MKVGIIGGGIAGLTCALALSRHGHEVIIHEQAPVLTEVGAGIQLSPNAIKPLDRLGLLSAINGVASAPRAIDIFDGQSAHAIASVPLAATAEKRYGAPYYVIHRADLQNILADACARVPSIRIQLGSTIGRVRQDGDGVHLGNERVDLLVAADGVHSKIREQHFGQQAVASGLTAWRTTIAMDDRPDFFSASKTNLCLAPNAHLVTYPIAAGKELNLVGILPDGIDPAAGFGSWSPRIKPVFDMAEWLAWPLKAVPPLKSWTKGRIVLIGDAAHAMLPFAAQGGAAAIEDGYSLAEAISAPGAGLEALAPWQEVRKKRVEAIARSAQKNRRIYHMSGFGAAARNMVMKAMGPDRLLARQDWIYGH